MNINNSKNSSFIGIRHRIPLNRSLISEHRTKSKTESNQFLRNNDKISRLQYEDKHKLACLGVLISIATREANVNNNLSLSITVNNVKQYLICLIYKLSPPNESEEEGISGLAEDLINIANIESPRIAGIKEWFLNPKEKTYTISTHIKNFITEPPSRGGLGLDLDRLDLNPHDIYNGLYEGSTNNAVFKELCEFFCDSYKIWIQVGSNFCQLKNLKDNVFSVSHASIYQVLFDDVFIKQAGFFANRNHPISLAANETLIYIVRNLASPSGNFVTDDSHKILLKFFNSVFIQQAGVFADSKDPKAQAMVEAMAYLLQNSSLADHNKKIFGTFFNSVFIQQAGVFADSKDPKAQAILTAMIDLLKNSFLSYKNKKIFDTFFENVFIKQAGVFADPEDPKTQAIVKTMAYLLQNSSLAGHNKKIFDTFFNSVFIQQAGVFANSENPMTKAMVHNILDFLKFNHTILTHEQKKAVIDYCNTNSINLSEYSLYS